MCASRCVAARWSTEPNWRTDTWGDLDRRLVAPARGYTGSMRPPERDIEL